ncbi:MAG: hypothetical protein C0591_12220, partial [Marinilabiliales bacterium]
MKRCKFLLIIIFLGGYLHAQDACKDIIKKSKGTRSIVNCCIDTVKNGNIVVYTKKGKTYEVKAIAITRNGERINLVTEQEKRTIKCSDAVHPTDSRKSILNCCIKEIKPGNVVVYTIENESSEIEAIAVNYKGEYFDLQNNTEIVNVVKEDQYPGILYEGNDYAYYNDLYKKASGQMTLGITFAALGGVMVLGGTVVMQNNYEKYKDGNELFNNWGNGIGTGLFLLGIAGVASGIPISVSGAMKKKRYKPPMDEIKRQANLSLNT